MRTEIGCVGAEGCQYQAVFIVLKWKLKNRTGDLSKLGIWQANPP